MNTRNNSTIINTTIVLILIMISTPLSGLGIDLYSPSLPAISKYFSVSHSHVKFTITAFIIGFAIGQPFFGTFSDAKGRRLATLIGLSIFTLASIIASLAINIYLLISMRLLQGLAVSATSAVSKAIINDCFSGDALHRASVYRVSSWVCAPIIAPMIGGYLQHFFGWRSNFYFFSGYGFICLLATLFFLKETNNHQIPFNFTTTLKNYQRIITHKKFFIGCIIIGFNYGLIVLFNLFGPFIIIDVLHHSSITFGHTAFIIASALLLGTLSNRILIKKFNREHILKMGITGMFTVSVTFYALGHFIPMNLYTITIPIFIIIVFMGWTQATLMIECLSIFPNQAGIAAASQGLIGMLLASIMSTLAGCVHVVSLAGLALTYVFVTTMMFFLFLFFNKSDA